MAKNSVDIHLRLPPALRDQVAEAAAEQGISLNAMTVLLVAGGVGFKLDPKKRARAAGTAEPVTPSEATDEARPG